MYRAILWGIGKIYNHMVNTLAFFEMKKQLEIVGLTANELPPYKEIDGHSLLQINEIQNMTYDLLIIMNERNYHEIVEQAVCMCNVPREKIVPYWVFEIPRLDLERYMELRKSRISIISNNCWGGIVYRTLGMEVLSPFKNLFLEDQDYIKLLTNLKYYLECEPQFSEYNIDMHSKEKYPVLLLDDIRIHCNHDNNPEVAIADWNRRKEKINWNNLFIEMYTDKREIEVAFINIEGFDKRICFVPYETNNKGVFKLKLMRNQKEFYETVNENANNGRNAFAYYLLELIYMNDINWVRSW